MALRSDRFFRVPASAEELGEPPCSQQCKTQWCWAACIQTAQVLQIGQRPRQCTIVAVAFPDFGTQRIDCCNDALNRCNRACPENLVPSAFANNGIMAHPIKTSALKLPWIRSVITAGGQVAVGWKGPTSNHMVLVVQASPTEDLLVVCDPDRFGSSRMTLAQLKKPDGRWQGWKAKWVWQG